MPLIILAVYMAAHVSERYFRVSFPMEEFMDKMKALASDYLKQTHHTQDGITWDDALENIPKTLWEKYGFYKADDECNIAYPPDFHVTGDAFLIFPKSVQLMQAASSMTSYLWVRLDQEILEQSQEGVMDRIQEFVCIWAPRFVDFGEKICGRSSKKPWRTNPSLIGRYSRKRKSSTRMNTDVNPNMPRL